MRGLRGSGVSGFRGLGFGFQGRGALYVSDAGRAFQAPFQVRISAPGGSSNSAPCLAGCISELPAIRGLRVEGF